MALDQLIPLLLGPVGLTVGSLYVVYQFSTGKWISRERLDEANARTREVQALLDKSLDGNESMASAMEERNRLEKEIASRGGLSGAVTDAERRITRRTR